ncbi:strictosidine synthase [Mesorhizobium sp. RP14(2022)]|uniref:Strictosidine synthase n=1 Tax=Mesorhizobium liriopis TaxID=2953882 RepID=A0ABT1CBJ6_9HYPH|nr:strictosidine synthase [Mesorhizobium liriopis]MCO6052202.1 strictosidine synthase [Mesorhizobium liriopis]
MSIWNALASLFSRSDDDSLSIPPLDGPLKPNNRLDEAERIVDLPSADNLVAVENGFLCSGGDTLYRIDPNGGCVIPIRRFEHPITALAASPAGIIAVGIEREGVLVDAGGAWTPHDLGNANGCITSLGFRGETELLVTIGSHRHPWSDWKRDLMSHGKTGAVLSLDLAASTAPRVLSNGLAFPYGLALSPNGEILVAESWKHRLVAIAAASGARLEARLEELPAYPARLAPAASGGYWLACFAPRRQLTEMILREDDYRAEMMATIPPSSWIGPDFADHLNDDQPLQSGSVRQMGILKPWAPSRSYGLVLRLNAALHAVASYHSRADGAIHGVTSIAERGSFVYAAARGTGAVLRFPVENRS